MKRFFIHYFVATIHHARHISILSLFFLILSSTNLLSQSSGHGTIEGRITNATDGTPIIGATVLLQGTVLGATTDINGKLKIINVPHGKHVISISMIGFRKERREISIEENKTYPINITLNETALQSEEVVITASKRPQSLEEVPVSISVMDGRDIEKRSIVSLDQALRYIPGVNMTESQVNVRGSSGYSRAFGTRVLILVDGIALLTGDSGEIKYDAIPMYAIERIEVVKGAGSALYGSSALGGVINVITKIPRENFIQARLYSGFYDDPRYSEWKWWINGFKVFNGIDIQRGGVMNSFSYLISAGVRNNRGYRLHDDDFRWNVNAKTWFEISPVKNLNVGINYTNDDRGNWIFWRDLKNALVPPLTTDLTERIKSTKFQATSQYRQTVDDNFAFAIKVNYYRTSFDTRSDTSDFSFRPLTRTQSTAQLFGLEWQGSYLATEKHFLTFGVDGSYSHVDALTYGKKYGFAIAFYSQDDYKILDGINLSLGVRGDLTGIDTSKSEGRVNPRVGLAWTLFSTTTLRASLGTGFRAPSIAEKYAAASGSGVTTKPNPELKSESSVSFEIGAKHQINTNMSLDAALFQSDYHDLVEPALDPKDGRIYFDNVSRARIRGFEVGIQSSWLNRILTANLGYTYIYPRDLIVNKILKYRPRHLFYANGAISFLDFVFEADFRYLSRVEEIDDVIGIFVRDADKRVETFVTDLRLSYNFLSLSLPLRATFAVNNLFNYNYVEIVGNLSPIRNFVLTIETRF